MLIGVMVSQMILPEMLGQQLRRQMGHVSCGQSQYASGQYKAYECVLQVREKEYQLNIDHNVAQTEFTEHAPCYTLSS